MNKLTALAVALLASTAAYAEPYQTNEQFRTNWNTLEEKAHLSRVEHSVLPPPQTICGRGPIGLNAATSMRRQ